MLDNFIFAEQIPMRLAARTLAIGALAAFTVLNSRPAAAQEGPWSVSFDLGAQLAASGDVHGGGTGRVLNLPTTVEAKSYGDVYGPGFFWAAGVGYKLTPNGEIRVQGGYTSNPADRLQVGNVANLALFAAFDDYKAFNMDFGYRQYLSQSMLRPFVGASVGFTRVDTINSTFTVPAAGVTLTDVPMNASSTVPAFGLQGGAQIALNSRFAVQVGADLRWQGDLKQSEGLAGTGLERINDETRRWSLPITGGLTVRF